MSERLTVRLFKGPTQREFEEGVTRIARSHGGDILWDTDPQFPVDGCRTSHHDDVQVLWMRYQANGADSLLCMKLGDKLNVPWMEARVQEGSHWDFSLYLGGEHLDTFSTLPEYWVDMTCLSAEDREFLDSRRGRPDVLAKTWNVPQSSIENYMRAWGWHASEEEVGIHETLLRGRAYAKDECEYGDIWQLYDFLRALGAAELGNQAIERCHSLRCPCADQLRPRTAQGALQTKGAGLVGRFVNVVIHKFTRE